MTRALMLFICFIMILSSTACAPKEDKETDYEATKKMVVDILKTDEGKEALQEMLADEKTKGLLIMDDDLVISTIQKTLTSEEGKKFWEEQFKNPKFVETFAKSIQEQNKKIQKDLMKDPQYQEALIEILQDPEMEKAILKTFKGKEFRLHLQGVIIETFESPLYKAKLTETLTKIVEEVLKSSEKTEGAGKEEGGGGEE
jgi:spore germination protein D